MTQIIQTNEREKFVPQYLWAPTGNSRYEQLLAKPKEFRENWLKSLTDKEKKVLLGKWDGFFARPKQLPPPKNFINHPLGWKFWVVLAGRGFGKTRLAAEEIRHRVENNLSHYILLAAPTYREIEETMIEGESGLLEVFRHSKIRAKYTSKKGLTFYDGKTKIAQAQIRTGEEPERFRSMNLDFAWFDELAAFNYLSEVWFLFTAALRKGNAQAIFTTTPKSSLLKINLLHDPQTVCTFGSSRENKNNVSQGYLESMENIYEDSDFAEQELEGVLYLDDDASLFKQSWINKHRLPSKITQENKSFFVETEKGKIQLLKIVVAVDPSGSSKDLACECGIVVAGVGSDNQAYVLEDLSKACSPGEWTKIAVQAAAKWNARIVYESNYGGEMPRHLFKTAAKDLGVQVQVQDVRASKNKVERAIPVSPLIQKGRVRFIGHFDKLEKQMTTWQVGEKSPDRMDALVWAITNLILQAPVRTQSNLLIF